MKEVLIFPSILLLSLCVIAQPPLPNFSSRADSLYAEGDIPAAISEYRKMLINEPRNPGLLYKYACVLSIDNSVIRQFDSCFKYLYRAVEADTSVNPLLDPDLLAARKDARWKTFEDYLLSLLNKKYSDPYADPDYARALWRMGANDQAFFSEIGISVRKFGMRSSVTSALWRAKLILSEINQRELEELLQQKGWPKLKDVGPEAVMSAYLVVQHADGKMQKKYLPDVRRSCEKDEIPWERYALMYDRMCVNENIPQRYGTHTRYNEKTVREELYPLEDPSKVDQWRKEAGLVPLSDYLRKLGISFNQQVP